jgi:hypothetical protein
MKPSRRLGGWKAEVYLDRVAVSSADSVGHGVPLKALLVVAAHNPIKIGLSNPVPVRGELHEERRDVRSAVPVKGDADRPGAVAQHPGQQFRPTYVIAVQRLHERSKAGSNLPHRPTKSQQHRVAARCWSCGRSWGGAC